jgi:hypothetical protein
LKETTGGLLQATCQFIFLDTVLIDGNFFLTSDGTSRLAVFDIVTAKQLQSLQIYGNVRSLAVVKPGSLSTKQGAGVKFSISINVIGPESLLDQVGDTLCKQNASLEHPYALQPGIECINAQFSQLDGCEIMTLAWHRRVPDTSKETLRQY